VGVSFDSSIDDVFFGRLEIDFVFVADDSFALEKKLGIQIRVFDFLRFDFYFDREVRVAGLLENFMVQHRHVFQSEFGLGIFELEKVLSQTFLELEVFAAKIVYEIELKKLLHFLHEQHKLYDIIFCSFDIIGEDFEAVVLHSCPSLHLYVAFGGVELCEDEHGVAGLEIEAFFDGGGADENLGLARVEFLDFGVELGQCVVGVQDRSGLGAFPVDADHAHAGDVLRERLEEAVEQVFQVISHDSVLHENHDSALRVIVQEVREFGFHFFHAVADVVLGFDEILYGFRGGFEEFEDVFENGNGNVFSQIFEFVENVFFGIFFVD
jgi:hypothetical protein